MESTVLTILHQSDDTLSTLMGYPIRGATRRVVQIDPKNNKIMIEYTHY